MNKRDVIEFFDRCAPSWDAEQVQRDAVINAILDNARIGVGMDVLDVACGTGVLFPFYLERDVRSITGIDISPEMIRIASGKYAEHPNIRLLCGDAEELKEVQFQAKFDAAMVYNAFPHFVSPQKLISTMAALLKPGGRLTIAHGASRETIDAHHSGSASRVSNGLMPAEELAALLEARFDVNVVLSTDSMYQVTGRKR